jgi:RNA polymerase sigma factor (sigma-70 family)
MSARLLGATLHTMTPPPVSRLSSGPRAADDRYADWDDIYSDNVARIYRMMYSRVGNRPDAEDLTAEVFLAALRPLRTGASRGEVRGYLAATAQSKLAGFWRRCLGVEVTTLDQDTALRLLDDSPSESDAGVRARRILDDLPERYRQILELRFLDALSVQDAARAMGVSVANAKVLQHRALRMAGQSGSADQGGADCP